MRYWGYANSKSLHSTSVYRQKYNEGVYDDDDDDGDGDDDDDDDDIATARGHTYLAELTRAEEAPAVAKWLSILLVRTKPSFGVNNFDSGTVLDHASAV